MKADEDLGGIVFLQIGLGAERIIGKPKVRCQRTISGQYVFPETSILKMRVGDFAFVDSVMGDHRARFLAGVDPFGSHFCSFQNELTKGLP